MFGPFGKRINVQIPNWSDRLREKLLSPITLRGLYLYRDPHVYKCISVRGAEVVGQHHIRILRSMDRTEERLLWPLLRPKERNARTGTGSHLPRSVVTFVESYMRAASTCKEQSSSKNRTCDASKFSMHIYYTMNDVPIVTNKIIPDTFINSLIIRIENTENINEKSIIDMIIWYDKFKEAINYKAYQMLTYLINWDNSDKRITLSI